MFVDYGFEPRVQFEQVGACFVEEAACSRDRLRSTRFGGGFFPVAIGRVELRAAGSNECGVGMKRCCKSVGIGRWCGVVYISGAVRWS